MIGLVLVLGAAAVVGLKLMSMTYEHTLDRNAKNAIELVTFTYDKRNTAKEVDDRVIESPNALWLAAQKRAGFSFSFDTFLLATMASSEYNGYSASQMLKAAVMHVALNNAKKERKNLTQLLIPNGKLGGQQGGYATTRLPPRLYDVLIAKQVLDGTIKDPTDGAIQFDSPRAQDAQYAKGEVQYNAQEIARRRIASGRSLVLLPGEDPKKVRFWA